MKVQNSVSLTVFIRNMDITSANFKERLPEIEKAIETATFISIDGEFTGFYNN